MQEIVIDRGWRDRLQDLAARRKEAWPLFAVVGAAIVVTLLLTGRGAPARVAPPARPLAAPSGSPSAAGPVLLVHVAGAVRTPGLYEFPPGARVADAVETAGGPVGRADLDALNLAEPLVDGKKVEVPRVGQNLAISASGTAPATGVTTPGDLIPLNSADQAMLETIPGVGPVTATAILTYREQVGSFSSLEELLEVDGIGPATFDNIRPYVTL